MQSGYVILNQKNLRKIARMIPSIKEWSGMRTECLFQSTQPYSLHDMRIDTMTISDGNLLLTFEYGYVRIGDPCKQVDGIVRIEQIDSDFCTVYLLSKNGREGMFQGEKLELQAFLEKYPTFSFEVVDELYGYHKFMYGGYLSLPGLEDLIEMQLMGCCAGSIVYETTEEAE